MTRRQRILIGLAGVAVLVASAVVYLSGKVDEFIAEQGASGAYLAARQAARLNDAVSAGDFYDRALMARPANVSLLQASMQSHILAGRIGQAVIVAQNLLAYAANNQQARILLAIHSFKQGQPEAALEHLNAMVGGPFAKVLEPNIRLWIALAQKDEETAAALINQLGRGGPFMHVPLIQAAHILEINGNKDAAVTHYADALRAGGGRYLSFVLAYGGYLERNEEWDKAQQIYNFYQQRHLEHAHIAAAFERIAKQTPARLRVSPLNGLANAFATIGETMAVEKRLELALGYYRIAHYLDPQNNMTSFVLGDLLVQHERYVTAAEQFAKIGSAAILYEDAQIRRAQALYAAGAGEAAIAVLNARLKQNPDDRDILISLGDLYRSEQRFAEAEQAYSDAIELLAEVTPRHWYLYFARGMMRERLDNWDSAESDLQRARKLSGDEPHVLNYLGYSWINQGIYLDEGLKIIQQAVGKEPNNGAFVDSLGWAHFRLGNYARALKILERASRLEPTDPVVTDHLGDALWRLGRKMEARYQWRKALAFKPTEDERGKIEAKLITGLGTPAPKKPKAHMPRGGTAI